MVIQTMRVGDGSNHTEESRILAKILLYIVKIVTPLSLRRKSKTRYLRFAETQSEDRRNMNIRVD